MLMYWCTGGPYLGFYQERGSTVEIVGYRTVTGRVQVWHTDMVPTVIEGEWVHTSLPIEGHYATREVTVPEEEVTYDKVVPAHYETETKYIQGHYETQEIWIPEHEEKHFVEVPGYYEDRQVQDPGQYEIQNIWVPEYYVTRYYWREAHPARGLEAAWIPYQHLIPAGFKDQRVWVEGQWRTVEFWVDATFEYQTVVVPGQYRDHRVWVDGNYEDVNVWIPERNETVTVIVPEHKEIEEYWVDAWIKHVSIRRPDKTIMVEQTYWKWEDVEYQEPIFGYADLPYTENLELVDHIRGPVMVIVGEPEADTLKIRYVPTGDEFFMDAEFVGCAVRIGENQYVIPEKYWEQTE